MSANPAYLPADYDRAAARRDVTVADLKSLAGWLHGFRTDANAGVPCDPVSIEHAAKIVRDIIKRLEG